MSGELIFWGIIIIACVCYVGYVLGTWPEANK